MAKPHIIKARLAAQTKKTAGATAGIIRPLRPPHGESTGMGDHFIGDSLIFL